MVELPTAFPIVASVVFKVWTPELTSTVVVDALMESAKLIVAG